MKRKTASFTGMRPIFTGSPSICLKRAGISTVMELANKSEEEMMKVRNLGKKSLKEVKEKLEAFGLHFREM